MSSINLLLPCKMHFSTPPVLSIELGNELLKFLLLLGHAKLPQGTSLTI